MEQVSYRRACPDKAHLTYNCPLIPNYNKFLPMRDRSFYNWPNRWPSDRPHKRLPLAKRHFSPSQSQGYPRVPWPGHSNKCVQCRQIKDFRSGLHWDIQVEPGMYQQDKSQKSRGFEQYDGVLTYRNPTNAVQCKYGWISGHIWPCNWDCVKCEVQIKNNSALKRWM